MQTAETRRGTKGINSSYLTTLFESPWFVSIGAALRVKSLSTK